MVFSYEEKVIIIYLWIKYKYGATRIVHNHLEHERNIKGVKKLLKKINATGDVPEKEDFGRSKSVRTERNIKLVEEMVLSQEDQPRTRSTPAEIACELNFDRRSMSHETLIFVS